MSGLIEMTALRMQQPRSDASVEELAAWYEGKARLHELLAAEGGPDAKQEAGYAVAAHEHALRLLREQLELTGVGA